jgi:hypothetical protein
VLQGTAVHERTADRLWGREGKERKKKEIERQR